MSPRRLVYSSTILLPMGKPLDKESIPVPVWIYVCLGTSDSQNHGYRLSCRYKKRVCLEKEGKSSLLFCPQRACVDPPPLPCPFVQPPTSFTGMAEVASCAAACCVNPLAGMWVLPSLCLQVAQVNAEIHHAQCCLVNVAKIFLIWSGTNGEANVRSFKT